MAENCDLSWLFTPSPSPASIRKIDHEVQCRENLQKFANGAKFVRGNQTWSIFVEENLSEYRRHIGEVFANHCPPHRHLGVTAAELTDHLIPEFVELSDFIKFSVEVRIDGVLAGALLSSSVASQVGAPEIRSESSQAVWAKYIDVLAALNAIDPIEYAIPDEHGKLPLGTVDVRRILYLEMNAVSPAFSGNNLCYDLFVVSAALGYLAGLNLAIAKCVNPKASHFAKIGGVTLKPILYKDIEVSGRRPFEDMTDADGVRFAFLSLA